MKYQPHEDPVRDEHFQVSTLDSLDQKLEMETSKFTMQVMSFQRFSNIVNPCGELTEQVSAW